VDSSKRGTRRTLLLQLPSSLKTTSGRLSPTRSRTFRGDSSNWLPRKAVLSRSKKYRARFQRRSKEGSRDLKLHLRGVLPITTPTPVEPLQTPQPTWLKPSTTEKQRRC
jgi:hypothetical protein